MIAENYACAYKEVIEVLKYTKREDVNKIPKSRILLWRINMNKDYDFKIDTTKTLEENINRNKILEENNKKLEKSNKELLSLKEQYEKTITNLQEEIKTLKTETLKAKDIEKKYSKLSFDPIGTVKVLHENINKEEYSEEDLALFNILTNK